MDPHMVRRHIVITSFPLLVLLSGTLSKLSGILHYFHHLNLTLRHICFLLFMFTKRFYSDDWTCGMLRGFILFEVLETK